MIMASLKVINLTYEGWIMSWIANRVCLYTYYVIIEYISSLLRSKVLL